MNEKRIKAQKQILEFMKDIDPTGNNYELWKMKLNKMTDSDFDKFMKNIHNDCKKNHLEVQLDQSSKNGYDMLNMDHIEKLAKKYGIKLREYVIFRHLNKDDPDHPFVTATPVPVVVMYIRKMQQMVQKKNFSAGNIDVVNPLTGQVTGDSASSKITNPETQVLISLGMKDTLKERIITAMGGRC